MLIANCQLLFAMCELLKPPDQSGGTAVVALLVAQIARADVVTLHSPGKFLEEEFVVDASANIDCQRIVSVSSGLDHLQAGHAVNKRPPLSVGDGKARTRHEGVLGDAVTVDTTAVEHESQMGSARQGHDLARTLPAFQVVNIRGNHKF